MRDPTDSGRGLARILLVDDDRLILATLSAGLRHAGYLIDQAENGEEALRLATEHAPDLAVLDVRMPGMSGFELARHLQEKKTVPYIFLSAYSDMDFVHQAAHVGALGYLVKPQDINQIVAAIETALSLAGSIRGLRKRHEELDTALTSKRITSVAVGILMERLHLSEKEAFNSLRGYARTQRRKIEDLAADIVSASAMLNRVLPRTLESDSPDSKN